MKKIRKLISASIIIILICSSSYYMINRVTASSNAEVSNSTDTTKEDETEKDVNSTIEEEEYNKVMKDETVYVNLNHDGTVSKMNVVNYFKVLEEGIYQDYGIYENITNLTNDVNPVIEDDIILWELNSLEEDFYYQGQLSEGELPWGFDIEYKLNGTAIKAEDLPGVDGELSITINVKENKDADLYFRQKYMMQITVPLNMQNCTLISAPGAVQMIAGRTKTLAFTVLPETSNSFVIQAQVQDFAMLSMDITMMKADLTASLNTDDMTKGFSEMSDGMAALTDGSIQLTEGLTELSSGIGKISNGLEELSQGTPALSKGMDSYYVGLKNFSDKMGELSSGSNLMKEGLQDLAKNGELMSTGYQEIESGMSSLLSMKKELSTLAGELAQSTDPSTVQLAQALLGQLEGIDQLQEGLNGLNTNLVLYMKGVEDVAGQYAVLNSGISALPEGFHQLSIGYNSIKEGNKSVFSAVNELSKGLIEIDSASAEIPNKTQLLADGQQKMTAGIDEAVEEIAKLTGTSTDQESLLQASFVAPGKVVPNSVQFILRTPSIEKVSDAVESVVEEEKSMSFWDKLVDLFR